MLFSAENTNSLPLSSRHLSIQQGLAVAQKIMMLRGQRNQDSKLEGGHPGQSSAQVFMGVQGLKEEGEEAAVTASSVSSSSYTVIGTTAREEHGAGIPSCPQDVQGLCATPTAMVSGQMTLTNECSVRQDPEGSCTSQEVNVTQIMNRRFLDDKLGNLIRFLLRKYQKKEQITKEEMLRNVEEDCREHFLLIFRKLCYCICPGFGIEVREVDPLGHTYVLVPILGLTFNGILDDNDDQIIPKIDLLIFILSVIFIKGNHVSEEDLKELLRRRKVIAERKCIFTEEPWKFITEDLVREGYLEYRQIPNSDPACYEFLWGPRAHAETSKMKVLEHVAQLERASPRSYPYLYVEASREEQSINRVIEGQEV